MDGVDAALGLEVGGHRCGVVHVHAAVALVAGVDAAEYGQVAAGLAADVLDDEPGQAHAVLKAAAELVGALVCAGGDEGAHEIAVGAVDLDHVDACQLGAAGGVAVALDEPVDLFGGHGLGDLTAGAGGDGGSGLERVAGQLAVALGTGVLELDADLGPVGVAAVGHGLEAGDDGVIEEAGLARAALGLLVYDGGLYGDEAEAALGAGLVVGGAAVGQGAVGVGEVVAHGRHDEAVGHGHGAYLYGCGTSWGICGS